MGAAQHWGAASLGATLHGGAALLGATLHGGTTLLGATLSLGRRAAIPSASHDDGLVLLHNWGVSVSCGSTTVLASHAHRVEVSGVMGVALGVGAGVANVVSRGSS